MKSTTLYHPASPAHGFPPAFHVMVKPRGAICNLNCRYCFYLQKVALYPASSFHMSDELLEEFTRQYIQAQQVPEVTFAWQGGEPTLMGLDFFEKAVALQRRYQKPGMHIQNTFQTNGILLDECWCQFLEKNHFLVGVSLDGPERLHDAYRLDKGGQPTFQRVMKAVELLQSYRVDFNILACINDLNSQHPMEVYRFFRDEVKARFIQFIPIVERSEVPGELVMPMSVSGQAFGDFMIAVFDEWVRNDVGQVFVQHFDVALSIWMGMRAGLCVHEPVCGHALAMEHNGDVFACDHFVDTEHLLGNIQQRPLAELVQLPKQRQFGRDKKNRLPTQCRRCQVRFICNGGCPKDRLQTTPDGQPGLNYLCAGYHAFFTHIDRPMKQMTSLIKSGKPPADIMKAYRRSPNGKRNRHRSTRKVIRPELN